MITRKQYLDNANKEATHRAYYGQFVDENIKNQVIMAFGRNKLKNSRDDHFNNISLRHWDALTHFIGREQRAGLRKCGDYMTQAGGVCILKEAARQIREEP